MISARAKAALAAAKRRGVKLGGDRGARLTAKARAAGNAAQRAGAQARAADLADTVKELQAAGCESLRAIAAKLDARGIPAGPRGPTRARQSIDSAAHQPPFRRRSVAVVKLLETRNDAHDPTRLQAERRAHRQPRPLVCVARRLGSACSAAGAQTAEVDFALSTTLRLRGDFVTALFFAFLAALSIAKYSRFLPFLISAAIQRGIAPRPAQVSDGFFGFRYLGATFRPFVLLTRLPVVPDHVLSPKAARSFFNWAAFLERALPILSRSFNSASTDIDARLAFAMGFLPEMKVRHISLRKWSGQPLGALSIDAGFAEGGRGPPRPERAATFNTAS
jgi:hypothetical protein